MAYRTGKALKALREEKYNSSRAFARDAGLNRETIRKIENGDILPTNKSFFHILKVLDVALDSTTAKECIAMLYEERKDSGSVGSQSELKTLIDDNAVSEEKIEQLVSLFAEYINPERRSDSFMHFLRNRITKILE